MSCQAQQEATTPKKEEFTLEEEQEEEEKNSAGGKPHNSIGASIESPPAPLTKAELPPVNRFRRVLRGTRTSMSAQ